MSNEKKYILTIDDKEYTLVDTLEFNGKKYVYLTELKDFSKYLIGELIDDEVIEIEDQSLLGQVILEFAKLHNDTELPN